MSAKVSSNQLSVEFSVLTPKILRAEDLQVKAVFTNEGKERLRLKTLFLGLPVIHLRVCRIEKTEKIPLMLGPPPLPPADDGTEGREDLAPGQHVDYVYKGVHFFGGQVLAPGKYEIRFRYENQSTAPVEWKGVLETDWVPFQVGH